MKFSVKQAIKDVLLWVYWYPYRILLQRLPFRWTYFLAGILGKLTYYTLPGKRRPLERELSLLDKTADRKGSGSIIKKSFVNLFRDRMEVLLFPVLNEKNIGTIIRYSGIEHLDKALSSGRGVILLFAHFGANQMVMPAIGYRGYKMSQLSSPPTVWKEKLQKKKFSSMEERALELRWKHELSLPVKHINIFGSLKEAFLCLKRNEILGVAIDGGGGKDRAEIDFLGRKAVFSTGAIDLALRTDCSVLPTFMVRDKSGYNTMIIEEPLNLIKEGDDKEAVKLNTEFFIRRLQEYVVKYPCHYLNFLTFRTFVSEQGDTPLFT